MKILIPNATGPLNIGDQAILHGFLSVIREKYKDAEIVIHSSDPKRYGDTLPGVVVKPHLYFWAVFENSNPFVRVYRLAQMAVAYLSLKYNINLDAFLANDLSSIINDYKQADSILFTGGGYLRTNKGFTQSLNLLMLLEMFNFAKASGKPVVIGAMSFGPFAHKWQANYAASVLEGTRAIFLREKISLNILNQFHLTTPIHLSSDMAFLLDSPGVQESGVGEPAVGYTVRQWFAPREQAVLEQHIAEALLHVAREYGVVIQPIVQVYGHEHGQYDDEATDRIAKIIAAGGATVRKTIIIQNVPTALDSYSDLSLLVGMRMHSNILAAVCGVPFVGIAYEHKTTGIAQDLGLADMVITAEEVMKGNMLHTKVTAAYSDRVNLKKIATSHLAQLRSRDRHLLLAVL